MLQYLAQGACQALEDEIWHVDGVAKLIRDELLRDRDVADHKHVAWLYHEAPPERSTS